MNWLTYEFWTLTGWEFDAHSLHPINNRSRNARQNLWVPPDDLCSRPETLCLYMNIFTYMYVFLDEFCYRTYIYIYIYLYIYKECRSVLVKLHLITVYRTVFCSVRFLYWMILFVFFGLLIVPCCMINSQIPGCLWPLVFLQHFVTGYLTFCNLPPPPPPRMFLPLDLSEYRIQHMVPSDPFMSHLATQLRYSAREFQALQLIVVVCCRGLTD